METALIKRISDGKFRKHEHILKSRDFRAVYCKRLSVKDGPFVLSYSPNGLAHSRLGFSISSRSLKSSPRRNRIRRLFRETYRRYKFSFKRPVDIVFILRRDPPKKFLYKDAEEMFIKLTKKAGILK